MARELRLVDALNSVQAVYPSTEVVNIKAVDASNTVFEFELKDQTEACIAKFSDNNMRIVDPNKSGNFYTSRSQLAKNK